MYNARIIRGVCERVVKRHNIKIVVSTDGSVRTPYYFDGRIYRQGKEDIANLVGCEEAHIYREWKTGVSSELHDAIGLMVETSDNPKKVVGSRYKQRIMNGENFEIFLNFTECLKACKRIIPLAPTAVIGQGTDGLLCLADCILKITEDGVMARDHTPEAFFISFLDINYNVRGREYVQNLKRYMGYVNDWADNDPMTAKLICQILGAVIRQGEGAGKCFVLCNPSGGNGKSTFLNSIIKFVGQENISGTALQAMGKDSHQAAEMAGKFANIIDEMSANYVGDISFLKTSVTGGYASINHKNIRPYIAKVTATTIIACNEIPTIGDKSGGLGSRLCIMPFTGNFRGKRDEISSVKMEDFFSDPMTRRAMLEIAIKGLIGTLEDGYVIPKSAEELTKNFLIDNLMEVDSAFRYIDYMEEDNILGMKCWDGAVSRIIFTGYEEWCKERKITSVPHNKFTERFKKHRGAYYDLKDFKIKGQDGGYVRGKRWIAKSGVIFPEEE